MTSAADIREIFETMSYGLAPESPATAQAWLDAHAPHLGLFIDNEWRDPSGGEYFPSVNPANAQPLIEVAQATARMWTPPCAPPAPPSPPGARRRDTSAPVISTRWRGRFRSTRGCSPSSRRWTTASQSARRATLTSRSSPATSTITPAGRN